MFPLLFLFVLLGFLLFCFLFLFLFLCASDKLVGVKFLHFEAQESSNQRSFSLGLTHNNLFAQFKLDQFVLDFDAEPMRIDVHNQLRSIEMFRYFQLKERVISILILSQPIRETPLIALPDIPIFVEHLRLFRDNVFLGVFLPFFLLFLLRHLHVHLSS